MTTCPTCGKPQNEPRDSNSATTVPVTVPVHLLPALEHALSIARTTAMMSEGKSSETQAALEDLRQSVLPMISGVSKHFSDYQWYSIFQRAQQGHSLEVSVHVDRPYWTREYRIQIADLSGKSWHRHHGDEPLRSKKVETEEEAEKLVQILKEELDRFFPMS